MITLRFEYGALDKEPFVLTDEWFQITYETIRNSKDDDVAIFADGFWYVPSIRTTFTDVVLIGE